MFSCIGFDWDGTLFDSMEFKRENFVKIFSKCEDDKQTLLNLHYKYSGIPRKDLFNVVYKEVFGRELTDFEFKYLSQKYSELNHESAIKSPLFPEVISVLEKIRIQRTLFISSSMPPEELRSLVKLKKIDHYFDEILGSEPGFGKGPEHVRFISERYNKEIKDFLFVGDDDKDVELAASARVKCLQVIRKEDLRRDNIIKSLSEILEVI
ncbi:MAG: HAD family hydrolase [Bacteriovoracaceae bacterium]